MLQEYEKKRKTHGILKANGNLSVRHQFKIALFLQILKIYILTECLPSPLLSFNLEFKATGLLMCSLLPSGFLALRSCVFSFTLLLARNFKICTYMYF